MAVVCFVDCPPFFQVKFDNSDIYVNTDKRLLYDASNFKKHFINNETIFA